MVDVNRVSVASSGGALRDPVPWAGIYSYPVVDDRLGLRGEAEENFVGAA